MPPLFDMQGLKANALNLLSFCFLFTPIRSQGVLLPSTTGRYDVGISMMKMVDRNRQDPFAPIAGPRAVMTSMYFPVNKGHDCEPKRLMPYMPPKTAAFEDQMFMQYGIPNGTLERVGTQVCRQDAPLSEGPHGFQHPVLLFSPGLATTRTLYGAFLQQLASTGFIVVSLDHAYDTDIVEYPDGTTVLGLNFTDNQIVRSLAERAADATFVLNEISEPDVARRYLHGAQCGLDVRKAGIWGHSLGGATALAAMIHDTRFVGGVNLDGSFWGPGIEQGTGRRFLIFAHEGRCIDPTWTATWAHLAGWKKLLQLAGSKHATFTDIPVLLKVLGYEGMLPPAAVELLGTIDGGRVLASVTAYVIAFMGFVLSGGKEPALLQKPDPGYPEITFISITDQAPGC